MNLLFDLDGTLADPLEAFATSLYYGFETNGLKKPDLEDIRKCIGPPLHISLTEILGVAPALAPKILEDYRQHHAEKGIYLYRFYQGAAEALTRLQKNHRIFVATSKPVVMAKTLIEHFGFAKYFEVIYGSELNGVRSNKGELISYLLKNENLDPLQTIMIGDRKHDIEGAKANKLFCIGVTWGFGSRDELQNFGANYICESWHNLESFISKKFPVV